MKKRIIKITFCALLISIGIFIGIGFSSKEASFDDDSSKPKQVVKENTLSMMIEQTAGAGDYKMETRSEWPTDGYVFNTTLSKCENGGEVAWDSENNQVLMVGTASDRCYIYFDIYDPITLADYVKALYTGTQGDNNIYYHDSTLSNGAGDKSYRYAGASSSVNNYVCFGSDEETCPRDNLYRIIGVFGDQVKLIKYDYATTAQLGGSGVGDYYGSTTPNSSYYKGSMSSVNTYYWNYKATNSATNTWSTSLLNKTNLNTNFITYLDNINKKWTNMIAETTWKVGGNTWVNVGSVVVKTAYQNEMTSTYSGTDNATEYKAKIGLMYVSDYGYAASPSAWSTILNFYNSSSVNWMYMGVYEWTIYRSADSSNYTFVVRTDGSVSTNTVNDYYAVRPVFYLVSTATYSSGTGTNSDPIRLG